MNDQTYFLANAAHELQTLLSLLCSSIQAIEAAHPEVRCYRYWPELSSDCRLMTKLLRDLTDYSMSDQLTKQRNGGYRYSRYQSQDIYYQQQVH